MDEDITILANQISKTPQNGHRGISPLKTGKRPTRGKRKKVTVWGLKLP